MSPYSFSSFILTIAILFSSFSSAFSGETIESLIREGDKKFNETKCEDARRSYRDATKIDPDNLPARLGLAYSLYRLERYEETARELKEAIRISPRNISLYYWLINTISAMDNGTVAAEEFRRKFRPFLTELWLEDDYSRAIADFLNIINNYPDNAWAGYLLGQTYLKSRSTEKARLSYQEASRLAPGWAAPLVALNKRPILSNPKIAVNNLEKFLEENQEVPRIYYTLGSIYRKQELPGKARAAYESLLVSSRANSLRAKAYFRLCRISLKEEDYQQAIAQLNHSINLSPETLTTSFLPDISRIMRSLDISPDQYRKQLQKEPDNINLAYLLAGLAGEDRDYGESIELYRKVMELCLQPAKCLYINSRIINAAVRSDRIKELENTYLSRLEKKPPDALNYFFLANLYYNRGRPVEAIKILQISLKHNPRASLLRSRLAHYYRRQGQYPEAITQYHKLIDTHPNRADYYGNLADCLFKTSKSNQGKKVLTQLCQVMDRSNYALSTAGNIYRRNGMYSDAIKSYSSALDIQPDDYFVSLKLAKLYIKTRQYSRAGQVYRLAIEFCEWPEWRRSLRRRLVRLYSNTGRLPELAREYEERLEIGE